jgi:hypothetical protein
MLRIVHALSTLFASLAFVSAMARPPAIEWQTQTSGVTVRLRGVSAVSSQVAWASGANGTVLRTTDGGRSWQLRPVPGAEKLDFRDVDAMSDRVAFALSIGPGESSRIYKTSVPPGRTCHRTTGTRGCRLKDRASTRSASRGAEAADGAPVRSAASRE